MGSAPVDTGGNQLTDRSGASVAEVDTVLRFDHDTTTDIVYIDMYDSGVYLDKPSETVRQYVELQRRLQAIALGPVESRNFMVELAGQFAAKPD